ncbi:phosphate signaling complex protein PhoU [Nitrincola iocasae]|jgi:phosphate transport system protein|uniref:Phosphate-specific transport system accessory protein PhoU n=1 Tax=Nitrincola iocasae TaxID=2614693 RepID=A0A5J6LIQ4_9GAMM|nr:phosphate signaling complex protein PhoU [Nitrincola iocasae]QEW08263.1 phosphate signaling complex protein PhoU [Nitrincola iocasae]
MNNQRVDGHTSQAYDAEMNEIVNDVLAMGELVIQQVERALNAFINADVALAQEVISADTSINDMEVEIDDKCVQVLVKRQPAAGDLRAVIAVIKTIKDLERIGDQAKRIARMAAKSDNNVLPPKEFHEFATMGGHVTQMLHGAMSAFRRMDADEALKVALLDKQVDSDYEAILRQNMTYMLEDPRNITRMVEMTWVGRAIERIGDHARNVCEYTIYFVKGRNVRHTNDEELQAIVRDN